MEAPNCRPFLPSCRYKRVELRSLGYDGQALTLDLQGVGFEFVRVRFVDPVGFRVLDECDLCEFWEQYHAGNGWMYEVTAGGWQELESRRAVFNSPTFFADLREYLVVSNKCVSVLATGPPDIFDVGADPA